MTKNSQVEKCDVCKRAESAALRAEKHLAGLESREGFRCAVFVLLLLAMAAGVYLLNAAMPLILDDYDFMYSWKTGELLEGFADVIRSQMVHYRIWGGRLLHVFTQSFLYLGKDAFNIANTVMFMLLVLEIYAIARPKRRWCWTLLVIIYLALLTMLPFFGTVFLWLTGACIYLFGTVLALMPLVIARSVRENGFFSKGRIRAALCLPAGILAGWTNENTTLGMVATVLVLLAYDYLKARRVSPRLAALWIGQCIGAALLLLAPGNFSRASVYAYDSMLIELVRRFVLVTGYGVSYLGVLLALVLLLAAGLREKARLGTAGLLVFAALTSVYAMVGSPELSDRTYTGPFVLMLCALLVLTADGEMHVRRLDAAKLAALPLMLVFLAYTGYHALGDVRDFADAWHAQLAAIEQAACNGEAQIQLEAIDSDSRFTMDIVFDEDAGQWPNSTIAKYYGVGVVGR